MAEPIRWQDRWWHQQPDGSWLLFNDETQTWESYSGSAPGQPVYAPSQGMSTGAKWAIGLGIGAALLVIVMILAAIAIPVFLRQREKGWTAQAETALKNAAIAEESYYAQAGEYTTSLSELEEQGFFIPAHIDVTIVEGDAQGYCLQALHDEMSGEIWSYDSDIGRPREGPCP